MPRKAALASCARSRLASGGRCGAARKVLIPEPICVAGLEAFNSSDLHLRLGLYQLVPANASADPGPGLPAERLRLFLESLQKSVDPRLDDLAPFAFHLLVVREMRFHLLQVRGDGVVEAPISGQ